MDSKYYIPEIEEFHVGLDYEFRPRIRYGLIAYIGNRHEYFDYWKKGKINNPYCSDKRTILDILQDLDDPYSFSDAISYWKDGALRVKLLDKEDIESLGWKDEGFYNENPTFSFKGKGLDFEKENRVIIHNQGSNEDFNCFFDGTIKNKSELSRIMKMIGI